MDSLKMLALVLAIIVALVASSLAGLDKLPNNCALVAIKAQDEMGAGQILFVYGTVNGKRMGHAVYVLINKGQTYVYDQKGTRHIPMVVKAADLAPVVAKDAFLAIPADLSWTIVY
jgi:hypothetical protein